MNVTLATAPLSYEHYYYVAGPAPLWRMGIHISRADGRPFTLKSLDYLSADTNIEIGTTLTSYADFANYVSFAPAALGSPTGATMTFAAAPTDIARVDIAAASNPVVFNPATASFTTGATVTRLVRSDGTIAATTADDPLVGGTVQISGTYSGTDLVRLSNVTLNATTFLWTSATGEQLSMNGTYAPQATFWTLAGPLGAFPIELRPLTSGPSTSIVHTGSGSAALAGLAFRLLDRPFTMVFRLNGAPQLDRLETAFLPPLAGTTECVWATDGAGACVFGAARLSPNQEFLNIFDISPAQALGAGPFYGIGFGPLQLQMLGTPLGVVPIHATANASGAFFWGVPSGTLPPGLTIDVVVFEIGTAVTTHGPTRLVF